MTPERSEIQECVAKLKAAAGKPREELSAEVRTLSTEYSLTIDLKFYVILEALFGDDITTLIQDPKFSRVLKPYSRKYPDLFLVAFSYVYSPKEDLHKWFATIFKHVMDMHLVDDGFLLSWYNDQVAFTKESVMYSDIALNKMK